MLYEPTARNVRLIGPLKQMFMQALLTAQSQEHTEQQQELIDKARAERAAKKEESTEADFTPEEAMMMIASNKEVDYTDFLEKFEKVLKNEGLARIDGESPVTESFLAKLPMRVLEGLAGTYLSNFIAPSL
jgi:predicted glycosyl hydrolase (DUF1957 family)